MLNVTTVSRIKYVEYKDLPSGTPVMNFQIGSRNRKKEDGYTNARVSVFGQQATFLRERLSDGDVVEVRGSLEIKSQGDKSYTTIYADKVNPFVPTPQPRESSSQDFGDDDTPF